MHDVMLQYRCSHSDGSSSSEQELSSVASDSPMKRSPSEYDDEVIVTSVGFADRQASLQAAVDFDTEKAIADLYAHVARMPDSAHKRRLVKQFAKSRTPGSTTPNKRKNFSFTPSVKKILGKRPRGSDDSFTVASIRSVRNCESSQLRTLTQRLEVGVCESPTRSSDSPVKNLFNVTDAVSRLDSNAVSSSRLCCSDYKYTNCIDLSDAVEVDSTSCGIRHELLDSEIIDLDDDVVNEPLDDDCCSSDKENAVFPFHHTASVVAMERIFAAQRLPNFVRPKGYISPLRCPALLSSAPVRSHSTVVTTP